VGLASYAAAAIARSNPLMTCVIAAKLAIAGWILPFFFVFSPEMLFINATPFGMVKIIFTCIIGMFNIAVGIEGFLLKKMFWPWRLIVVGAGFLLIAPSVLTDLIGIAITATVFTIHWMQYKRDKQLKGAAA